MSVCGLKTSECAAPVDYPAKARHQPARGIVGAIRFEQALLEQGHSLLQEEGLSRRCDAGSSEEAHELTEVDQNFASGSEAMNDG